MKSTSRFLLLVSWLACLNPIAFSQASEPSWVHLDVGSHVSVQTNTGRVVRGAVDKRTTDQHLWIVAEVEGMAIGSRLSREAIVSIQLSAALALPAIVHQPSFASKDLSARANSIVPSTNQARSLFVFAQLENWDQDPEFDGLGLYLIPRDSSGTLVPVAGSVSASLTTYHGDARSPLGAIKTEESWAMPVAAKDYSHKDGYVRLPFRKLRPETDTTLQPVADLHVRLSIVGQGVLEASMEDVVVRPYSATQELRSLRSKAAF